jgi:molybdate transport system ATP-binding protein
LHDELKIPVLYVTHSVGELARLSDQVVLLEDGQVSGTGSIGDLFTRPDLSLLHGDKAAALIVGEVAGHDTRYDLTLVDFSGGRFYIPRQDLAKGQEVRLRVVARDVSITLEHQTGTSILNILPATILTLIPEGNAQYMVRLAVGEAVLLARVTGKSVHRLDLTPGKSVYIQVKSVALLA